MVMTAKDAADKIREDLWGRRGLDWSDCDTDVCDEIAAKHTAIIQQAIDDGKQEVAIIADNIRLGYGF
jgi:hypothetical protein